MKFHGLTFVALMLFTISLLLAAFGLQKVETFQKEAVADKLQTVLKTTQRGLHIWAEETKREAAFWADHNGVPKLVNEIVQTNGQHGELELEKVLGPVLSRHGYAGYFVLDKNGIFMSGSRPDLIGKNGHFLLGPTAEESFPKAMKQPLLILPFVYDFLSPPRLRVIMVSTAPVHDRKGRLIGILGFQLYPILDFTSTVQLGRMGKTGETYAFNRSGFLVTESRFPEMLIRAGLIRPGETPIMDVSLRDPGGNLTQSYQPNLPRKKQPLTEMAESAISGKSGVNVDGYRDYRGVEVAGAWLWDDSLNLGLATEMDLSEAFHSYYVSRWTILLMLGISLGGAFLFICFLLRQSKILQQSVADLEKTRETLKQSVAARNEFISIAAHELRTPLTPLRMHIGLLEKMVKSGQIAATSPATLLRLSEITSRELTSYAKLIQNLLDISNLLRGRHPLELEKFDLALLVQEVVEKYSDQLRSVGIRLTFDKQGEVIGYWDRIQLEQVIANLLSNAIRYGMGRPISIRLKSAGRDAELIVQDQGVGIRKEDQTGIFGKFEQTDRASGAGLGLGLYIVKRIVEAHRGLIRVESEPGKGSSFIITLPRNVESSESSKAA